MTPENKLSSSFRDDSGFLYRNSEGALLRQVNHKYSVHYSRLMDSGLYKKLVADEQLVPHEEIAAAPGAFKTLKPELLPFISYPYEWAFHQLKDAALLTLSIQKTALAHGMILKDASAYNIQFKGVNPVFIDTLSFEIYKEDEPWAAYRQFCMHFLAPLALCAHADPALASLLRQDLGGISLATASRLLPKSTWLNFGLLIHLHLHAKADKSHRPASGTKSSVAKVSRQSLLAMADSLTGAVSALKPFQEKTFWQDYYADMHNYQQESLDDKATLVKHACEIVKPATVWDMGANTGKFSAIAAACGAYTVAMDFDRAAVEAHYLSLRENSSKNILPLIQDLNNPSPALGWAGKERASLKERGPADMVFALALVHHICIGNNVPIESFFSYLSGLGKFLLVEFVPKEDSQVKEMLLMREDIFPSYTESGFEEAAAPYCEIIFKKPLQGAKRTLYLFKVKH